MALPLVSPIFLMQYGSSNSVSDYRCAVDSTGTNVVFERSVSRGPYHLQILDLATSGGQPQPLVPSLKESTRPDWSWGCNEIAFSNGNGVWYATGSPRAAPTLLPNTAGMIYPA
jgi:hypothetical protein